MDERPSKNPLWMVPFSITAARGLIRERRSRRATMSLALLGALVLLVIGSTVLHGLLMGHPIWFLFYWFACAWLTMLAILLALFDLLMVRRESRQLREQMRREFSVEDSDES